MQTDNVGMDIFLGIQCQGKFMVGYTDLHPGMDYVAAWRDPQQLCISLPINPNETIQPDIIKRIEKW